MSSMVAETRNMSETVLKLPNELISDTLHVFTDKNLSPQNFKKMKNQFCAVDFSVNGHFGKGLSKISQLNLRDNFPKREAVCY